MKITGTFLDEISIDIPHQNWGRAEWDADFSHMKSVGIDSVYLIRSGLHRFITYPSKVLVKQEGCYEPPVDLVKMFLELSDKHGMNFYFGLYDSGKYWANNQYQKEIDLNMRVIDEVWKNYGHFKSFKGWYLAQEISRRTSGIIDLYAKLGKHCKDISNNLPTFISPWIDGKKTVQSFSSTLTKDEAVTLKQHEEEWNEIFDGISKFVDAVAFQDGHVEFHELDGFFEINKRLARKYKMECWTNAETFDRDMPIKYLPIKFEKLRMKLEAARKAGFDKAITFEFSHFLSPQSAYLQAGHLFDRYKEYIKTF
ncbi:DUF4434 domain-containing protein [Desertivirga brevis]|uniref:DUF4434 domain-containing protein n=1 Tax=Desertivirga brevis TaxID=2810310 RepID=UPI001A9723F3|nr:DUF4434 domain-containing protein [Pedobacter sp. SYSU D00873]